MKTLERRRSSKALEEASPQMRRNAERCHAFDAGQRRAHVARSGGGTRLSQNPREFSPRAQTTSTAQSTPANRHNNTGEIIVERRRKIGKRCGKRRWNEREHASTALQRARIVNFLQGRATRGNNNRKRFFGIDFHRIKTTMIDLATATRLRHAHRGARRPLTAQPNRSRAGLVPCPGMGHCRGFAGPGSARDSGGLNE